MVICQQVASFNTGVTSKHLTVRFEVGSIVELFKQSDVEPTLKTRDPRECRRERRGTVCHAKTVGGGGGGVNLVMSKIVMAFIYV